MYREREQIKDQKRSKPYDHLSSLFIIESDFFPTLFEVLSGIALSKYFLLRTVTLIIQSKLLHIRALRKRGPANLANSTICSILLIAYSLLR